MTISKELFILLLIPIEQVIHLSTYLIIPIDKLFHSQVLVNICFNFTNQYQRSKGVTHYKSFFRTKNYVQNKIVLIQASFQTHNERSADFIKEKKLVNYARHFMK